MVRGGKEALSGREELSLSTPTHYLPLATYFLLPTAYHLPPTTYHLLPTAYCLLPTAYCLLPTTYHLLPSAHVVDGSASDGGHAQRVSEGAALLVVVDQAKALDRLLVPHGLHDPTDHRTVGARTLHDGERAPRDLCERRVAAHDEPAGRGPHDGVRRLRLGEHHH